MAAIWAVGALYVAHAAIWTYLGPVIIACAPLVAAGNSQTPPKEVTKRIWRVTSLATVFEVVAIIAGVNLVVRAGRADLATCVIAGVVGLHFFPLARWFPVPRYYLTGLALIVGACVGLAVPSEHRDVFVASATSAILWATAVSLIFSGPRLAHQAS
jgi:hypothetical protein